MASAINIFPQRWDSYSFIVRFLIFGDNIRKMRNPLIWAPNKDESNINFRGNMFVNTLLL